MDDRNSRSDVTRSSLMRAAEKLIAERGIEQVSIRGIVQAAGQKNESALQYHFGNLQGLVDAIHEARKKQVRARRAEMLAQFSADNATHALRDLCTLMVAPPFLLARERPDFRLYIKAFGHMLTLTPDSALDLVDAHTGGGPSGRQLGAMLRGALPHLDEQGYRRRMDGAIRFVAASMYHHAHQRGAFRGTRGDLFLSTLLDSLVGLLSAPVSAETSALVRALETR